MSLDLTKLTEAVKAVAGVAAERDAARTQATEALLSVASAQADVDTLTASLLAAVASPAEAVGIAAVAAVLPQTVDELNEQIAKANSTSALG